MRFGSSAIAAIALAACKMSAPAPATPPAPAPQPAPAVAPAPPPPPAVEYPGTFLSTFEWTDTMGKHLLVLSESSELRHEPGVRWSPTEFVTHTASHYAGHDALTLRTRDELRWICSHPDREHAPRVPVLTDVDHDGLQEVVGALDVRCGDRATDLRWAFEGDVDLFSPDHSHKAGCGGGGRIPASLRGPPFEAYVRERWLVAVGLPATPASSRLRRARTAFPARPPATIPGTVEDGVRWTDASGARLFALSRIDEASGVRSLFATVVDATSGAVVTQLAYSGGPCSDDNATHFATGVLDLTDLDKDGIDEVTFAYHSACVSDASPIPTALVVLEATDQHVVRGRTWVGDGDPTCGPPLPLVFDDDPIIQLLDDIDPRGARHARHWSTSPQRR